MAWVTQGGSSRSRERPIRPTSGDAVLLHVRQVGRILAGPADALQPVVLGGALGEEHARSAARANSSGRRATPSHATPGEAQEETLKMLEVYREFAENALALPTFVGRKSDKEKFAGARATYSMEAMMQDGKALQAGTSAPTSPRRSRSST